MNLSENFTLSSLLDSDKARELGIRTAQFNPPFKIVKNLTSLCNNILQPLRDSMGSPLSVSSGFRCLDLNRALTSSDRSDHVQGLAADIYVNRRSASSRSFKLFQNGIRKQVENIIGQPVDLTPTSANFTIFLHLMLRRELLGIHQLIHEKGTFGKPNWIHVSYRQRDARNEILIYDGVTIERRLTVRDILGQVVSRYSE